MQNFCLDVYTSKIGQNVFSKHFWNSLHLRCEAAKRGVRSTGFPSTGASRKCSIGILNALSTGVAGALLTEVGEKGGYVEEESQEYFIKASTSDLGKH